MFFWGIFKKPRFPGKQAEADRGLQLPAPRESGLRGAIRIVSSRKVHGGQRYAFAHPTGSAPGAGWTLEQRVAFYQFFQCVVGLGAYGPAACDQEGWNRGDPAAARVVPVIVYGLFEAPV